MRRSSQLQCAKWQLNRTAPQPGTARICPAAYAAFICETREPPRRKHRLEGPCMLSTTHSSVGLMEVARVLHERMEPSRHVATPKKSRGALRRNFMSTYPEEHQAVYARLRQAMP